MQQSTTFFRRPILVRAPESRSIRAILNEWCGISAVSPRQYAGANEDRTRDFPNVRHVLTVEDKRVYWKTNSEVFDENRINSDSLITEHIFFHKSGSQPHQCTQKR